MCSAAASSARPRIAAMGDAARAWAGAHPGVEALAVTSGGSVWWTPGFEDVALFLPREGAGAREARDGRG